MIPTVAQYGSILVEPKDLAKQRGLGLYNPPPNFEQTTNRGPSYKNALNVYTQSTYYKDDLAEKTQNYDKYAQNWSTVYSNVDLQNTKDFEVGNTQMYGSVENGWKVPGYNDVLHPAKKPKTDQYQIWAVSSLNMTPNPLLNYFFSESNVDYLQNTIIQEVKRIRGVNVARQSTDELLIIMRNKYVYAIQGSLPYSNPSQIHSITNDRTSPLAYDPNSSGHSLRAQLAALNKSVLEECIKQVLSGIMAYEKYYLDASSLPLPLSRSVYVSSKGSNSLQENLGFQSGHEATKAMSSYNQRFNIL
jgi:hypothetical protein